ncbi:MAG: site-specific DNA-methyltransferase [Chloroflexota bacterium]
MTEIINLGDCLDLFATVPDQTIDLVIADPPYNLGKNYGNNHDSKKFDDYLAFSQSWLYEAKRVLKPTGTLYCFMGVRFISYLYDILERELDFMFNSWICWHYTQGMGRKRGFSPRHDDILMFNRSQNFIFNLDAVRVPQKYYRTRNNMRGANPGDVWEFSHVHYCQSNRQDHPTQKPEGLIERMVLASSNPGDQVLDPFAGSGTTLRVCQQLDRHCLGFELNPDYVALIKARLALPFEGFDSVDPRMARIPQNLTDPNIRQAYLQNHASWFLNHHPDAERTFQQAVNSLYNKKSSQTKKPS